MLASGLTLAFVFLINRSEFDLRVGIEAAVATFISLSILHSARVPWLLVKRMAAQEKPLHTAWGVLGLLFFTLFVSVILYTGAWVYTMQPTVQLSRVPDTREQRIADLQLQLTQMTTAESQDSLRRRTISLANKLDHFVQTRWDNHPSRLCEGPSIQNPTAEQTKAVQECIRYDNETVNYINDNFKEKWIGIVREYEGKGVKVANLVNDMEQNHPAQNTFLPFFPSVNDGNYMSAQSKFRELAYHVDARGNRIDLP